MTWLRRLLGARSDRVSPKWLTQQERASWTQGIEGVAWSWPVKKITNESPLWNRSKLRKSA